MPPSVSIHVEPVLDPRGAFRAPPVKLQWLAAPHEAGKQGFDAMVRGACALRSRTLRHRIRA
jgi:hypothetical protein